MTRSRWSLIALSAALVALALPLSAMNASASEARVVVAGVTPLPSNDVVVNNVITTNFDVALRGTNQASLTTFIASLSNTASANYHQYLTPAQYGRRFGASASSLSAVKSYLKSNGLTIGSLSKGRNILKVSGTTTQIAKAMDAPIETVKLSDGSLVAQLTSPATLPSSIANDVVSVVGLSSVLPPTTNIEQAKVVATPQSCISAGSSTGTTPNQLGGYTIQQQASLYGLSTAWANGDTGVGQTIAVYELGQYDSSDLATFDSCYGVTPSVTSINVDSGSPGGYSEEATLDVEETSVLAPGAAIEVYQGPNTNAGPTDIYSQIASDNTATIITTSWGNCEAQSSGGAQAEQPIFQEMAAQGQTVISAAGDSGSADCASGTTKSTPTLAVDDPASQPYVTGVGGLSVKSISPLDETVWNDNCTQSSCGAGGGGLSSLWSQPAWQKGFGITTTAATGGMRMVPDLSVMADPSTGFIEYYTGSTSGSCRQGCVGWSSIGGTSIGSPLVSALVATAAQACKTPDERLGFINPTLYAMPATAYNDVTVGTNDLYSLGEYSAGPGYDMASGLGSPSGAAFLAALCPAAFSAPRSSFAVSSPTAQAGSTGPTVSALLHDVNGNPVANAIVGVTATANGGVVSIDGDATSEIGTGSASDSVTSNATGALTFSVSSSVAQTVQINVTYEGQSIYTTTLTFDAAATALTKPGRPTITRLTPLVGGFSLSLRASTNTGDSSSTSYQYSLTGGKTWISIGRGALSVHVSKLARNKSYTVIARAVNAVGPSAASAAKKVVTRS
ncbi:MAG TPA: protease pro-enzyme activation domain-containing protein [Acidimicrobiales bacterium]